MHAGCGDCACTSIVCAVRANALWKKMLNEYEAPPLDQGIDDGLNDFMAKRKEALAGTGDF